MLIFPAGCCCNVQCLQKELSTHCFRNISASMSANPLVQEIQASRSKMVAYRSPAPSHAPAPGQPATPGRGDAEWQGVSGTRHKFFVYSAYCDDREKPLVRVIAATKTKKPDKVIQF